jgi:hypothetical protein
MRNSYRSANLITPSVSVIVIWEDGINYFLDNQKHLIAFAEQFPWFI